MIFQQPQNPPAVSKDDALGMWDQLPTAASTFTDDVDGLFWLVTWVSIFFFVLLTVILVYALVKWHRKTDDQPAASSVTHNTPLEVTWTVIPLIIVMVIFVWGWKGTIDMTVAPADALQYKVVGQKWAWSITHPGDDEPTDELWVPKGVPCKLILRSQDVLHSFYIPAFRAKRDVIPGRYQTIWFNATKIGIYDFLCTEYCGDGHSKMVMHAGVHVVDPEQFAKQPWRKPEPIPWKRGQRIYNQLCKTCHSIDGTQVANGGPTWKGLYGRKEELESGTTVQVDDEYIRESIRKPLEKVVKGYKNIAMTAFGDDVVSNARLDDIIAYIKELSK